MTKRELIRALAEFGDDQHVIVRLRPAKQPGKGQIADHQLFIQAAIAAPPWHFAKLDRSNWLVGLVCHEQNKEIDLEETRRAIDASFAARYAAIRGPQT